MKTYIKAYSPDEACRWAHIAELNFKASGDVLSEGKGDGAVLYQLESVDHLDFMEDGTVKNEREVLGTWSIPKVWPRKGCVIIPSESLGL